MSRIKAVVFDWAGTMIDFGSFAPMGTFVAAFREFGIDVSIEEARAPMGKAKRDHITAMMTTERVSALWRERFGHPPGDADIDRVYEVFVPMNEKVAAAYADLVPGALETIAYLKSRDIRIGSTTGYTRSIMAHVLPVAARQHMRRRTSFAPMTCRKAGRPRSACTNASSTSASIRHPA